MSSLASTPQASAEFSLNKINDFYFYIYEHGLQHDIARKLLNFDIFNSSHPAIL